MDRGIRKCLTFAISQIACKIFGEKNTQALKISKRPKFPQGDRTDTNFIAPLKMNFYGSKSTLDSLKGVFNVFKTNCRWVHTPDICAIGPGSWCKYTFCYLLQLLVKQ